MRSRIVMAGAGAALVVALTAGLLFYFNSKPRSDNPPAPAANRPGGGTAAQDPSHEAEETVSAAEVADLTKALQDGQPTVRIAAAERLAHLCPQHRETAVRVLLADFQALDPSVRSAALNAFVRLKGKAAPVLVAAVKSDLLPRRDVIGEILHHLGPDGLPALVAAFAGDDPDLHRFADIELHRWGAAAAPGLTAALQAPEFAAARPRLALLLLELDPAQAGTATPHLLALLREADPDLRRRALEVVVRIGPQPEQAATLVALLTDGDVAVRAQAVTALRRLGAAALPALRAQLADRAAGAAARQTALDLIGRCGPAAQAAAPELTAILKGNEVFLHHWAARALLRMGPVGVAALGEVVADPAAPGWEAAAAAVSRFGPAAKGLVATLGTVASAPDPGPRDKALAVAALENVGPDAVAVLTVLAKTPGGPERNLAIRALGRLAPGAELALPDLGAALRHLPDEVSVDAAAALVAYGPAAVTALREGLRDKEPGVRLNAVVALGRIGPPALAAVPDLAVLLQAPEVEIRLASSRSLAQLGPAAKEAAPALQAVLGNEDKVLRVLAAEALLRIDPAHPAAKATLQPLLQDGDPRVRALAAAALIQGDPAQAKELLPVVVNGRIDLEIAEALARLGPVGKPAVPAMRVALDALDNAGTIPQRQALVRALRAIGPDGAPALLAAVKRTDPLYRRDPVILEAARALAALAPRDAATVQGLADLVRDASERNPDVRVLAAEAVGRLGPDAAAAVPALRFALADEDVLLRARAVEALGRLGPAAQAAVEELQALAERDPFPHVRGLAAAALQQVNVGKR
jgi:HEAT repeat protein